MLVKQIMTAADLKEEFIKFNRDYFSYEACEEIVNLFDELEKVVELDVIGLCCEFSEETPEDIAEAYGIEFYGMTYAEAIAEGYKPEVLHDMVHDYCNYHSLAWSLNNGNILYQNF